MRGHPECLRQSLFCGSLLTLLTILSISPVLANDPYLPPNGSLQTWDQAAYVVSKLADAYLGAAEFNGGECVGEVRAATFCSIDRLASQRTCPTYFTIYLCLRQLLWAMANVGLVTCDGPLNLSWPLTRHLDCGQLQADFGAFTGR